MKVIVSNGSFKFHMAPGAAELHRLGVLDKMITAGYPNTGFDKVAQLPVIRALGALQRLRDREEDIPPEKVCPLWWPELMNQAWIRLSRPFGDEFKVARENEAMHAYARAAAKIITRSTADVYHYRAGYGHASVKVARAKGMVTICDHSIAHPQLIHYLTEHGGQYPAQARNATLNRFWTDILADIGNADHVLVNSDFVRDTFVFQGWDASRISVIYLGVDDKFLASIPGRVAIPPEPDRPLELLYAGGLLERKGFPVLAQALARIKDCHWRLTVAGSADPALMARHQDFFADSRVRYVGNLSREALATQMAKADVFVFPSLVEGSARVVFEALAAGCFVITTPNSGSIVEHRIHGLLAKAGDDADLERQVRCAIDERGFVSRVGLANQQLVFNRYTQRDYGHQLVALYERLRHYSPGAAAA